MNKFLISRTPIYLISFLLSLSIAVSSYVNSSFLGSIFNEKIIGIFYTLASIVTIIGLILMPKLLNKIGNYKSSFWLTTAQLISLAVIIFSPFIFLTTIFFILYLAFSYIIFFNIDIFLEKETRNTDTGEIRGAFLSIANLAYLISPLIIALALSNGDYWKTYSLSAIFLIPVIIIINHDFKLFNDPVYDQIALKKTWNNIIRHKNILRISFASFLLNFFYSWMTVYTPIFLHNHMGFSWKVLGIVFSIMLLPFVLLELPLGRIADEKLGEKEILCVGFIILGISTASMTFLNSIAPAIWAMVLFTTRVGASMIEIATESYFFKKINSEDVDILKLFRITRPLAYACAPLIATVLLFFIDFKYLFLILGMTTLVGGLWSGLNLKDTL